MELVQGLYEHFSGGITSVIPHYYFIMEYFYLYIIFSLSAAILSWYKLYLPTFLQVKKENPESFFIKHRITGSILWMLITTIFAPLFLFVLLAKDGEKSFITGFSQGILSKD